MLSGRKIRVCGSNHFKNISFDFVEKTSLHICTNSSFVYRLFWGELIDKYKDINANSKTVITDYAMLKLVLYSPHMFLLFCQSKVGVVNCFLRLRKLGPSWYLLPYRCNACWKPANSKREIYVIISHILPIY